jgi:sigma-54 dependent transcriptional regulator, acetoin dehydrogenase operon transcriptional activator AcoR
MDERQGKTPVHPQSDLNEEQMLRLLDAAVQQAREAILITTANLDVPGPQVIFINPAFTEMTGYSGSDILGKTPRILQGPKTDRDMLKRLRDTLSKGGNYSAETINYRKDGSEYYVAWDISPVRDERGQTVQYLSIQRDVTARKLAEAKLAELLSEVEKSRNDLSSILNELRLGTAMTDEQGRLVFLNSMARQLLGSRGASAYGRVWHQVFPLDREDLNALLELQRKPQPERTKVPVHLDLEDGRRAWLEVEVKDDPRDARGKIFLLYDVSEVHDLRLLLNERAGFHDLLGKSSSMQSVYQRIRDVARVDATVLIEGETGTGKELVARAIHTSSYRKDKTFIAVNCAGLTESLLGSQLFGHRRGAFTGAIEDHQGLFEAANGGTLFLDEIGDIPMTVQNQLLRVLQEREIVRLGESKPRKIDVRVLAATHRTLSDEVAKGNFRADLLYRIRVARILLPPLRQRREDIPLLAASFLAQFATASDKPVKELSLEALRLLSEYDWPGNVRELKSAVEYAVIGCKGSVVQEDDLPPEVHPSLVGLDEVGTGSRTDEKSKLQQALDRAGGNRAKAARLLGISRATFYRRLADLNIPSREK